MILIVKPGTSGIEAGPISNVDLPSVQLSSRSTGEAVKGRGWCNRPRYTLQSTRLDYGVLANC